MTESDGFFGFFMAAHLFADQPERMVGASGVPRVGAKRPQLDAGRDELAVLVAYVGAVAVEDLRIAFARGSPRADPDHDVRDRVTVARPYPVAESS